jgi:hypothetical protein
MMFENIQVKQAAPVLSRGQVVVPRHANGARVGGPGLCHMSFGDFLAHF